MNGNVKSSGQHRGIKLEGNHSTVRIGQYGTVDGGTIAVEMTGDHSELINYGTIKGSSPGASIYIAGGSYAGFVNHGIVTAITSMEGDHQGGGDQVVVHLGPTSNLQDYLEILSDQGDTATILNEGYMRASTGLAAFEGGVETRLSPTKGQSKGGSCSGRATTPSSIKAIVLRLALCIAT